MSEPRKYWLKYTFEYTQSKAMNALRQMDGSFPDIYSRILTRSLKDGCKIKYEGYFKTLSAEVADQIREVNIDAVNEVLGFLESHDLLIRIDDNEYYLPEAEMLTQSEGDSAERMRRHRARNKQIDENTSPSDENTSQSDGETSQSHDNKSKSKSKNKSSSKQRPPTQEEAESYFLECNFKSDPKTFFNYNQSRGWKGVEDWKAAAALWETREKETSDRQRGQRCGNQFNSFEQRTDSEDLDAVLLTATREKYNAELGTSFIGSRQRDGATGCQ